MRNALAIASLLAGSCTLGPALVDEPERCLVPSSEMVVVCVPGFQGGIPVGGNCQAIPSPTCEVVNPQWTEWRDKQNVR